MHGYGAQVLGLRYMSALTTFALTIVAPGLLAVACAGAQAPGQASPEVPTPATLTWGEIAEAIDRHPSLGAARSAVAAAKADVSAARAYPNPEVGLGLGTAEALEGEHRRGIWEIEISVPVLSPLAYRAGVKAAEAARQAVAHEAQVRRLDASAQLRALFLSLAHGQEQLRVLTQSLRQMERLAEVARLRVQHGEARPLEVQQFEIELARIELEVDEASGRQMANLQTLNDWLGGRLPADVHIEADLGALPLLPTLEVALATAERRHPELQATALRVESAAYQLRAEQWTRWPEISAGGFYERELDARSYGARVTLALPLWNWNGGGVARARAQQEEARWLRELAGRELAGAVRAVHAEAAAALSRTQRYQQEILPKAAATAAALERMYQIGEADVLAVLAAGREANSIEAQLWDANLQAHLAALRLVTLMGGEDHDEDTHGR